MEEVDSDDERVRRVIAGAAVLARRMADACTLTARELEGASQGAQPPTGSNLVAYRDQPRPSRQRAILGGTALICGAAYGAAEAGLLPPWVRVVAFMIGLPAAGASPTWVRRWFGGE